MQGYLLDTNICIFYIRGKYALNKKLEAIGFENCYISEITLAELKYGAECSNRSAENKVLINEFAKEINILPVFDCFDIYAVEKVKLRKSGNLIDDFDLLIASTAISNQLILVTDNVKHFDRIKAISIENWIER
ncbi:MAG: type II toxin-antitoxin system VapC family toxin [Dysgonamonadaceae bacterium]|jgi:tRNA(fMet)-specific endonuclease VapC|nr:type II toxin-antitoxin system VapC family toxin [Dysgonamonadaceae bacterium]